MEGEREGDRSPSGERDEVVMVAAFTCSTAARALCQEERREGKWEGMEQI